MNNKLHPKHRAEDAVVLNHKKQKTNPKSKNSKSRRMGFGIYKLEFNYGST